jgi:electron transfer flavoprotein beta subunit
MIGVALKPVPPEFVTDAAVGAIRLSYSSSDQAALALALDLGRRLELPVHVASAGPEGTAALLSEALRLGAARATWFPASAAASSSAVARRLAEAFVLARYVVCGDYSSDRGSGSVPAFLAAELVIAQALGLARVNSDGEGLKVARRLDGGKLQRLAVTGRCVLSVDPGAASPLRASLPAMLSPKQDAVLLGPAVEERQGDGVVRRPHRPRSKDVALPAGNVRERLDTILGIDARTARQRLVVSLPPEEAAQQIIDWIAASGYSLGEA